MPPEVITALLGFFVPFGVIVLSILRYIWTHFTKSIDELEATNARQQAQLETLLGRPATETDPGIEGELPKLKRRVAELSDNNDDLRQQLQQKKDAAKLRADERTREQETHAQEVGDLKRRIKNLEDDRDATKARYELDLQTQRDQKHKAEQDAAFWRQEADRKDTTYNEQISKLQNDIKALQDKQDDQQAKLEEVTRDRDRLLSLVQEVKTDTDRLKSDSTPPPDNV